MKQSIEERRIHHQTREDRQRKVYEELQERIRNIHCGRYYKPSSLFVYVREAGNLAAKLNI